MSLVACVIGKHLWNNRTSDAEFEYYRIGEQLNKNNERTRAISDGVSLWESRKYQAQESGNYRAAMYCAQRKEQLNGILRFLHNFEKILQRKKQMLDTILKMAKAMGQAFEKMEDDAIKRFAPKI